MEAFEDVSRGFFLPLGFGLFGQPILANNDGCFSSWSKITDIVDNLVTVGS